MIPEKRRQKIYNYIKTEKTATISEISREFDVSKITVRRDIDKLSKEGLLRKVYGGAATKRFYSKEPSLFNRIAKNVEYKKRIALEAIKRISDGDTIAMIAGSTSLELVKLLEQKENINVIAASPHIINELCDLKRNNKFNGEIFCTGGIWKGEPDDLFVGTHATSIFNDIRIKIAFIGILAINIEDGFMANTIFEAELTRKIISSSEKVIAIGDHTKFGKTAFSKVGSIDLIDEIITDSELDKKILFEYNKMVKITLC